MCHLLHAAYNAGAAFAGGPAAMTAAVHKLCRTFHKSIFTVANFDFSHVLNAKITIT